MIASLVLAQCAVAAGPGNTNPLKPPPPETIEQAKQLVSKMTQSERGPYQRLRWFCADGSVHEPRPYACAERGGGKQYAEYSVDRRTLADLGWHVGTVFAGLDQQALLGSDPRQQRLRELPLEKYLIDIDSGWVLRKAKNYRGRVQIEDEDAAGRTLLLALLSSPDWIRQNYLLLRELVRVVPHGADGDLNRSIRRLAQDIAQLDSGFERLRIEVHTAPSRQTIANIGDWLASHPNSPEKSKAAELLDQLVLLYGDRGRDQRLAKLGKLLGADPALQTLQSLAIAPASETAEQKVARLGRLMPGMRKAMTTSISASTRLGLIDALSDVEADLRVAANGLLTSVRTTSPDRIQILQTILHLVNASYGSGLLTEGELLELTRNIGEVTAVRQTSVTTYQQLSQSLNLSPIWAIGSIRYAFAEALNNYTALDPRSAGYVDDVLRSSPMLQLAEFARIIVQDVQHLTGVEKTILGQPASSMLGLNAGIAVGTLRILTEDELRDGVPILREEIVVLPQTVSELSPVAGVLTLGEGNLLSHIQLLARNFGIPNVSITQELLDRVVPLAGQKVLLVVDNRGSVLLEKFDGLTAELRDQLAPRNVSLQKLDVPAPDLSVKRPIPLASLRKELSGVVVGPKAANLGELNALFPGTVAQAVALPFGFFLDNVNQNAETNWSQLAELYDSARAGAVNEEQVNAAIAQLRDAVSKSRLTDAYQTELASIMKNAFGEDGSYGVFLRSDTNVEDLPGFTGAGLSETVPNVVGFANQMNTVPRIWASVLAPRAIAWRSNLLKQPETVYPSVLLMQSVSAEKSGVLITADLFTRRSGIITSTAWGVGGAVSGEAAESVLLREDGTELLVSEAKSAYQRALPDTGGVAWNPAPDGPVLTAAEKQILRDLAKSVNEKYPPVVDSNGNEMPWDIEFGFVEGGLKLFQIRPLVERGQEKANRLIQTLQPAVVSRDQPVDLDAPPSIDGN